MAAARPLRTPLERTIPELLSNLETAYLCGQSNTVADSTEAAKQVWWKSLQTYTRSRLTPTEQRIAALCKHTCKAALAATLQLDINGACRLFGMARGYSESEELGLEGRLLCQSDLAAAESSLDFVCHDFQQARSRLLHSLALDEELESRFGYKLLHAHRIHLLSKMVKLEMAVAGAASAMRMAACALVYLESGRNELSIPGWWGKECLDALPQGALQFLTRQISTEIAAALMDEPADAVRHLLAPIVNRADFWTRRAHWDSLSHAWCELKMLYTHSEKRTHYFEACAIFLAAGRKNADALWYLAALDAARACRAFPMAPARSFYNRIGRDLMSVGIFPLSLRKAWSKTLTDQ